MNQGSQYEITMVGLSTPLPGTTEPGIKTIKQIVFAHTWFDLEMQKSAFVRSGFAIARTSPLITKE